MARRRPSGQKTSNRTAGYVQLEFSDVETAGATQPASRSGVRGRWSSANLQRYGIVEDECTDDDVGIEYHIGHFELLRLIHRGGPNPHPNPLPGGEGIENKTLYILGGGSTLPTGSGFPQVCRACRNIEANPRRLLPSEDTLTRGPCCPHWPCVVSKAALEEDCRGSTM